MSSRARGELAIVLHSHMPYVEGFGAWPFGEEWLLEAIAACYLPLIGLLERWAQAGSGACATIGITPVLADQLELPEVGERFMRFMRETRSECHRLDIEGLERDGQVAAAAALGESARDYECAADDFEGRGGDLLAALRRLNGAGTVELWTSAATHAMLPLLETEAGARLQIRTGVESHRGRFGAWTGGFWLPECAYRPGIEHQLGQDGVRAFCVDQTNRSADLDQLEPVATDAGAIAIPIDWATVELVWNERGYPADPIYRDYHAPTINGMRAWSNSGAPYDREAAFARAREHARAFVSHVARRLDDYYQQRGRSGLCVCALDTELLGHWWYEGPVWLDAVAEEARSAKLPLVSLPAALDRHEPVTRQLGEASWGAGKDLSTWDSRQVAPLRWAAARAELALVSALRGGVPDGRAGDGAARAARELLALQSSDWAFMEARNLAGDYPLERVRGHEEAFSRALAALERGMADFPGMSDGTESGPALRGLAPTLKLSCLAEPSSPWGRQ